MGRRVRKHANPFQVRVRVAPLDRLAMFGREAPLEVDLGCGASHFVFERARNHPETDFVGLEVRLPMVELAARRKEKEGVSNLAVLYANAGDNLDLAPPGIIQRFHVHFPDPCFKKRHWKRRILQPKTVRKMVEQLPIGGEIYAQSDVLPLAQEMFDFLSAEGALESMLDRSMLVPRPFPEATAWEKQHENEDEPIYRMLFRKIREPAGEIPDLPLRATDPKRIAALG
jgi:tRNA (guanine-N7-)-methyltransferase